MSTSLSRQWSFAGSVPRAGHSLLELMAVLALMGIIAVAAVGRFRRESLQHLQADVDARRVSADLLRMRRMAISTGDNHLLVFDTRRGRAWGYTPYRRLPGGTTVATDDYYAFPDTVAVSVTPSDPEFDSQGAAMAGYAIQFLSTNSRRQRSWTVQVARASGLVRSSAN